MSALAQLCDATTAFCALDETAWMGLPNHPMFKQGFMRGFNEAQRSPIPKAGIRRMEWDTGLIGMVELHYSFRPGEPGDNDHPGYPDDCSVTAAYARGMDLLPLLAQADLLETAEEFILENLVVERCQHAGAV